MDLPAALFVDLLAALEGAVAAANLTVHENHAKKHKSAKYMQHKSL